MSDGWNSEGECAGDGSGPNDSVSHRWLVRCYRRALADYRLDRGDHMAPVVAMLVESAVFLTDPGGVQYCGMDAGCAEEYDAMNARIWQRLCAAIVDEDVEVSEHVVERIIDEEYERDFGAAADCSSAAFASIIEAEFTVKLPTALAPELARVSSLIWNRLRTVAVFHA